MQLLFFFFPLVLVICSVVAPLISLKNLSFYFLFFFLFSCIKSKEQIRLWIGSQAISLVCEPKNSTSERCLSSGVTAEGLGALSNKPEFSVLLLNLRCLNSHYWEVYLPVREQGRSRLAPPETRLHFREGLPIAEKETGGRRYLLPCEGRISEREECTCLHLRHWSTLQGTHNWILSDQRACSFGFPQLKGLWESAACFLKATF